MLNWSKYIKRLSYDDSCIFMWVTDAHIQDGLDLMRAWGFKYVTIAFIWCKTNKNDNICYNLGAWTLKSCEIVLFGTKGHMLKYKKANNIKQFFYEKRREHSRKPEYTREAINKMFGNLPKIELFAREQTEGWDCYGNEINKFGGKIGGKNSNCLFEHKIT